MQMYGLETILTDENTGFPPFRVLNMSVIIIYVHVLTQNIMPPKAKSGSTRTLKAIIGEELRKSSKPKRRSSSTKRKDLATIVEEEIRRAAKLLKRARKSPSSGKSRPHHKSRSHSAGRMLKAASKRARDLRTLQLVNMVDSKMDAMSTLSTRKTSTRGGLAGQGTGGVDWGVMRPYDPQMPAALPVLQGYDQSWSGVDDAGAAAPAFGATGSTAAAADLSQQEKFNQRIKGLVTNSQEMMINGRSVKYEDNFNTIKNFLLNLYNKLDVKLAENADQLHLTCYNMKGTFIFRSGNQGLLPILVVCFTRDSTNFFSFGYFKNKDDYEKFLNDDNQEHNAIGSRWPNKIGEINAEIWPRYL